MAKYFILRQVITKEDKENDFSIICKNFIEHLNSFADIVNYLERMNDDKEEMIDILEKESYDYPEFCDTAEAIMKANKNKTYKVFNKYTYNSMSDIVEENKKVLRFLKKNLI